MKKPIVSWPEMVPRADLEKLAARLDRIYRILYPNPDAQWTPDTISAVADVMEGYQPSERRTAEFVREALRLLPEKALFRVLEEALTVEQREELGESWFNIDRKGA